MNDYHDTIFGARNLLNRFAFLTNEPGHYYQSEPPTTELRAKAEAQKAEIAAKKAAINSLRTSMPLQWGQQDHQKMFGHLQD